jgi:hypothetical protein
MMQHVSRIGAYLETGSDFAQLGCLLEDRDIMPCSQKACSGGQSADPGSGNEDPVPGHLMLLPVAHLFALIPELILLPSQGSGEKFPVG